MMNSNLPIEDPRPGLLDVVTLLIDRSDLGLTRGAVGTVVEPLDNQIALVEFTNDFGRAQAIVACPYAELRVVSEAQA
ncbi:MAG: DUF4926 domain-containing protein [Acetobacteraceae bacterium]|jgi:hypothetical protein